MKRWHCKLPTHKASQVSKLRLKLEVQLCVRPNFNPLTIFSILIDVWCVNFLQQLPQSRFLICSNILTLSVKTEAHQFVIVFYLWVNFVESFSDFYKDCNDRLLLCVKMKMVSSEHKLILLETVHSVLKASGGFARGLRLSLVYDFCLFL